MTEDLNLIMIGEQCKFILLQACIQN